MKNIKKHKKTYLILLSTVAVAILVFYFLYHKNNTITSSYKPKVSATSQTQSTTNPNVNTQSSVSNTSTTSSPNTSIVNFNVIISRASVVGQDFEVGTLLNGNITNGTCILSISQTGQNTITQTNTVTLSSNNYVCPLFTVPLSSFPNLNSWNISVAVTSSGTTKTGSWINNPVVLSKPSN
jgi:hypothetical protein